MAATALAPADLDATAVECDEFACRDAVSHTSLCRCSCKGAGHGVNRGANHRLGFAASAITSTVRRSRLADVFAADDSDGAF